MKQRNIVIALDKFIFSLCIIVMHCIVPFSSSYFMEGAYIFVDFFFIVQGFFLFEKVNSNKIALDESFLYIKNRIRRFLPIVVTQMIFFYFFNKSAGGIDVIVELTFTSMILPVHFLNNVTLWFLSASIIVGGFVVYFLCEYKEKIIIFIPFIVVIIYNYMVNYFGHLDRWSNLVVGIVPIALFRALAGILLGVFCKFIYNKLEIFNVNKLYRNLILLICIGITLLCIYMAIFCPHSSKDVIFILLFSIIIVISNIGCFLSNNSLINWIDQISTPMYIFQMVCIRIIGQFNDNRHTILSCTIVILLDLTMSILWVMITKQFEKRRFCTKE